jgi:hypothetical protein
MAGEVRQPIDLPSLERYLNQNVPVVKTPLDLKQVRVHKGIRQQDIQRC